MSREIVRLATEYAGVDKIPDYLRSDTKDVTFLDRVIICIATIICIAAIIENNSLPEVEKAHASEQRIPQH